MVESGGEGGRGLALAAAAAAVVVVVLGAVALVLATNDEDSGPGPASGGSETIAEGEEPDPGGALLIQPVLSIEPQGADGDIRDLLPSGDGLLYATGPPLPVGIVESARAELDPVGSWIVHLVVHEGSPGIDDLNELAAQCSSRNERCPTGRIALVLDGSVVSAPEVNSPSFDRDGITISSRLSESEARAIADAVG